MQTEQTKAVQNWSFKNVWKSDLIAGFQVFLIALPLCLGIAIASGFPPMAGIVAAVVGGLVVSRISGSHVTINGPAAGLIVVILAGVDKLGHGDMVAGYKLTLAAIVCAGIIQIVLGVLKMGRLSTFFPVSAVHGMLAAIGIIIMVKQFPILFGAKAESTGILAMMGEMPSMVVNANPAVAFIGLASLVIMIGLALTKSSVAKKVPAPIIVVVLATALGYYFDFDHEHHYIFHDHSYVLSSKFLVPLPDQIFASLAFPDFSQLLTWDFVSVTLTIAIVASLESVLSAAAVDKLDPYKRKSNLNRDLFAVGVGTTVSGLLGGLPMIAEIVRSSANINNKAKTSWANFFHGGFLLLAVLLIPDLIKHIPLAVLAALLIYTGYRLASPREFWRVGKIGADQLLIFLTTIVVVLATDLLVGIAAGVMVKIILHLIRRVQPRYLMRCNYRVNKHDNSQVQIEVFSPLVFTNLLSFTQSLQNLPANVPVKLDLSHSSFIDHTAMDFLHELQHEYSDRNVKFQIIEHDKHQPYAAHVLAARRLKVGE